MVNSEMVAAKERERRRLAQALRENLKRRKARERGRAADETSDLLVADRCRDPGGELAS